MKRVPTIVIFCTSLVMRLVNCEEIFKHWYTTTFWMIIYILKHWHIKPTAFDGLFREVFLVPMKIHCIYSWVKKQFTLLSWLNLYWKHCVQLPLYSGRYFKTSTFFAWKYMYIVRHCHIIHWEILLCYRDIVYDLIYFL